MFFCAADELADFHPSSHAPCTACTARTATGERMIRALYGQAQALPASIFELGISPYINASIVMSVLLYFPSDVFEFAWLKRLKEARKEGKSVSTVVLLGSVGQYNWAVLGSITGQ